MLTVSGVSPTSLCVFIRSSVRIASGIVFGDGVRCATGSLLRLYVKTAAAGVSSARTSGDPSITARSAALGDPLAAGSTRFCQTCYRDGNPAFCPNPPGRSFDVSNGQVVVR